MGVLTIHSNVRCSEKLKKTGLLQSMPGLVVPVGEHRYGILDGQHRVAAARRLNMTAGYFAIVRPETPRLLLLKFGARNATTEQAVKEHAVERACHVDQQLRKEFQSASELFPNFKDFVSDFYPGLAETAVDEILSIADLAAPVKEKLLYVFRVFLVLRFLFCRNTDLCFR